MKDQAALVIMTMSEINKEHLFLKDHLELRKIFYNTDNPISIPMEHIASTYENLANDKGYKLKDWFYIDRWFLYNFTKFFRTKRLCFLVVQLEKNNISN